MRYVLISPVRNEAAYLEETLRSVTRQTVKPLRWVVVSDGSTDDTDALVREYARRLSFIRLLRREADSGRHFAGKVHAFNLGLKELQNLDYDFIGNLDGDVSFAPEYYQRVLEKFSENPRLGLAGGKIYDNIGGKFVPQISSENSVGGPIQLFRRRCFEEIGGYLPLKLGFVDGVAETMARMRGWEVRHFPELVVYHHRQTGTEGRSIWAQRWKDGRMQYSVGYHWLFHLAHSLSRLPEYPLIVGSLIKSAAFFYCCLTRPQRQVSDEFIEFLRREQKSRLKESFKSFKTNLTGGIF